MSTGTIRVVGLGPGDASLLAPMARHALEQADVLVGYSTYLKLVPEEIKAGKEVYVSGMTRELDRVEKCVEFAKQGKNTAMVSSGDAGVYGMSGLVLEYLEKNNLLETIPCEIIPGVPAVCAAAALLGAPLMHDFAVISLSDLLTPITRIQQRLNNAADADFVIVLYNPKSKRRTAHLPEALQIIGKHRAPNTPVGIVQNAYRPDQRVIVTTLDSVDVDQVNMLSILVIGNSSTRVADNKIITPRGYYEKYGEYDAVDKK